MRVLEVRNVHEALPKAMELITQGVLEDSRNGKVLRYPAPVATVYAKPCERVLFHSFRDANPFFHFYESLWMLGGRRDVAPLTHYVKRMEIFSDDSQIFNAAYGYRWRHATKLGVDQLSAIAENLTEDTTNRRQVLQIWSLKRDLGFNYAFHTASTEETRRMLERSPFPDSPGQRTRDAACNIAATFQISQGHLDMVVFCRSNDIIWGCYGANAVHFSFLLEYMARRIGVPVGTYTQISVNWHAYAEVMQPLMLKMKEYREDAHWSNPYDEIQPYPIMNVEASRWEDDLRHFLTDDGKSPIDLSTEPSIYFQDPFFAQVAVPIVRAHDAYKDPVVPQKVDRVSIALAHLERCKAADWRIACEQWLVRRLERTDA